MTDNLVQLRTCPRCGGVHSGHGAASRADSLTIICPDCGTREEVFPMSTQNADKKREQIQMFCMDDLVPQDHLLRLIDQAIDWSFIYDLVIRSEEHTSELQSQR